MGPPNLVYLLMVFIVLVQLPDYSAMADDIFKAWDITKVEPPLLNGLIPPAAHRDILRTEPDQKRKLNIGSVIIQKENRSNIRDKRANSRDQGKDEKTNDQSAKNSVKNTKSTDNNSPNRNEKQPKDVSVSKTSKVQISDKPAREIAKVLGTINVDDRRGKSNSATIGKLINALANVPTDKNRKPPRAETGGRDTKTPAVSLPLGKGEKAPVDKTGKPESREPGVKPTRVEASNGVGNVPKGDYQDKSEAPQQATTKTTTEAPMFFNYDPFLTPFSLPADIITLRPNPPPATKLV